MGMDVLLYSVLHFLIDGLCLLAMYDRYVFVDAGVLNLLIYNFCAFALQMPFGALVDLYCLDKAKRRILPPAVAFIGCVCTISGIFLGPVMLGIGNALFHVGGGVHIIRVDREKRSKGKLLGIFVAPGALGLFIGNVLHGICTKDMVTVLYLIVAAIILAINVLLIINIGKEKVSESEVATAGHKTEPVNYLLIACCFVVVIMRSHVGLSMSFEWKQGLMWGFVTVLMVVLGKMLGGIFGAGAGLKKTVVVSLVFATLGYVFSKYWFMGLMATLCFNMTMPITLYLLVDRYKKLPGFMFGLLTFGLFIGYLPSYFMTFDIDITKVVTVLSCLLSLALLLVALRSLEREVKSND